MISSHPILDNLGRQQQANFVNEDGLYDVILNGYEIGQNRLFGWMRSHGYLGTKGQLQRII